MDANLFSWFSSPLLTALAMRILTSTLKYTAQLVLLVNVRGGHAQLFFESAIAIPQLEGSTSAIAIPQLFKNMLLRNCNSAIPQSQFFLKSATSSPQLGSSNFAFFG
jgi:hypothetical protein